MPFDANTDNDRIRSLETQLRTLRQQVDRVTEKCGMVRDALCAKERSDGSFVIDYDALVQKLGPEACLELRAIIDSHYGISGAAGEKPKIRLKAETASIDVVA